MTATTAQIAALRTLGARYDDANTSSGVGDGEHVCVAASATYTPHSHGVLRCTWWCACGNDLDTDLIVEDWSER